MNLYPVPSNGFTPLTITFTTEDEAYLTFSIQ